MSGQDKKVLIVDDEQIVRLCCQRTLKPRGYHVTGVTDGFEALALLKDRAYDIVITDLKMPDMDGIEFIDMLKRIAPEARILLVTGYSTEETREQAEAMGARYLPKPFSPSELCKAVDNL